MVDSNLKFVSQRTHPRLALVHVDILESKGVLEVKAPRMSDVLHIPLQEPRVNEVLTVNVWGDEIEATEVHEDISRWFNTFLGTKDFKFVRKADHFVRKTDPKYAPKGQTAFSDGYPFLLCSTESLKDLNDNLEKPVSLTNFRPNIVVQGCDFAYEEDTWKKITINGLNFNVVKPCARCKMPTVDPDTGILDSNNEPMRSMKAFRKGDEIGLDKVNPRWKGEIFFGQNLDHESNEEGLVLHVGQVCTVEKK